MIFRAAEPRSLEISTLPIIKVKISINKWTLLLFPAVIDKLLRGKDKDSIRKLLLLQKQKAVLTHRSVLPRGIMGTAVSVISTLRSLSTQKWENLFSLKGTSKLTAKRSHGL